MLTGLACLLLCAAEPFSCFPRLTLHDEGSKQKNALSSKQTRYISSDIGEELMTIERGKRKFTKYLVVFKSVVRAPCPKSFSDSN